MNAHPAGASRLVALVVAAFICAGAAAATLNVGSKRFTESYILGEILAQTAQAAGETDAVHRQGLGNTAIVLTRLSRAASTSIPNTPARSPRRS